MASAVIGGMMSEGFKMSDVILFDRHIEKMKPFVDNGAVVAPSIEEAASMADCIMICVKPQGFAEVLPQLASVKDSAKKLYISIAAGVTMRSVSE